MGDLLELFGVLAVCVGTPTLCCLLYTLVQRFAARGGAAEELRALRARVARLEQSVDVAAEEIERVGVAQRFAARLPTERAAAGGPRLPTAP